MLRFMSCFNTSVTCQPMFACSRSDSSLGGRQPRPICVGSQINESGNVCIMRCAKEAYVGQHTHHLAQLRLSRPNICICGPPSIIRKAGMPRYFGQFLAPMHHFCQCAAVGYSTRGAIRFSALRVCWSCALARLAQFQLLKVLFSPRALLFASSQTANTLHAVLIVISFFCYPLTTTPRPPLQFSAVCCDAGICTRPQ